MDLNKFKLVSTPNMLDVLRLDVISVITEYDDYWNDFVTRAVFVDDPDPATMDIAFTASIAATQHRECCESLGIREEDIATCKS